MIISIDTNILLYSLNPLSAWHEGAAEFLAQHFGNPTVRMALTDDVLIE